MKKRFFIKSFRLMTIGALLSGPAVSAAVSWSGAIAPPTVFDTAYTGGTINITGNCTVNEGIVVYADAGDIDINVTTDAIVEGKLTGTVEPRLFLVADAGRKITVNVYNHLEFTGDSSSATPLLILVEGNGQVDFVLSNEKTVSFTAHNSSYAGTRFFVHSSDSGTPTTPILTFKRASSNSPDNVEVIVGPKSLMSYVSGPTNDDSAFIIFDPANIGSGRMALRIQDEGGVFIGVNQITPTGPLPDIYLSDIDMTSVLDRPASFYVTNAIGSSGNAGLLIINHNTKWPDLVANPWKEAAAFGGMRYGFILSGELNVGQGAFVDYVGLTNDFCPTPTIPEELLDGRTVGQVVKARNASAFIVDAPYYGDITYFPIISLGYASAVFFRSGVDKNGDYTESNGEDYSYVIDPNLETSGEGEIVFDVEGPLKINGGADRNSKIEILSLHVDHTGGAVLTNPGSGNETTFPLRDFSKDIDGKYLQYNSACALINNRVEFYRTKLVHTDVNHSVFEKDDVRSEPTYIGGDTFGIANQTIRLLLEPGAELLAARPRMAFYKSEFRVHTSVALTGVDLVIPNGGDAETNDSYFRFFHNGFAYSDGGGRQMILGTQIGASTCDPCCAGISRDAHLDIVQDINQDDPNFHQLTLVTSPNDDTIVENLPSGLDGQAEIHTIYLGHTSNISIGTQGTTLVPAVVLGGGPYPLVTFPTLSIEGNFFSFETRGGSLGSPESSAVSGQGGIFVDTNGSIQIDSVSRANISTMITKSGNGSILLPRSQVFFDTRVGIADWHLDLTDAAQRIVIGVGEYLSDYTINWRDVTKDYVNWSPYEIMSYDPCTCPVVTTTNVAALPTVQGRVDQLQIKGSRLGSQAHVKVKGSTDGPAWIRELVFLNSCDSADAPVGVVVIESDGRVGFGSAHRNRDSIGASYTLGVNGVTVIANGDGRIDLNEDIIIDNVCHILKGPDFDPVSPAYDKLQIFSDCCRSLVVKSTGVLDLRSFTAENEIVELAGNVKLILEPGAKVLMGGGMLRATDNARIEVAPVSDIGQFDFGTNPTSTDPIRVAVAGTGKIVLAEDAVLIVEDNAYIGIENYATCNVLTTSIELEVMDRAHVLVGSGSGLANSAFQIGNTSDIEGGAVHFTLNLSGVDSLFAIASRGFFGLGVGIVDNSFSSPSSWIVDQLFNIDEIRILVPAGTFKHDRIFNSDNVYASLLALGSNVSAFTFDNIGIITGDSTQSTILGGGNMALLTGSGQINPTVQTTDGVLTASLTVGLFSSKAILDRKVVLVNPTTAAGLFTYWKTPDNNPVATMLVNASQDEHNLLTVGYVDAATIQRYLLDEILGQGALKSPRKDFSHTLKLGVVFGDLGMITDVNTVPRVIFTASELP